MLFEVHLCKLTRLIGRISCIVKYGSIHTRVAELESESESVGVGGFRKESEEEATQRATHKKFTFKFVSK